MNHCLNNSMLNIQIHRVLLTFMIISLGIIRAEVLDGFKAFGIYKTKNSVFSIFWEIVLALKEVGGKGHILYIGDLL